MINLAGEWIGHYRGHFDEVVRIEQKGHIAVATKVTGDSYVPAGEITWRANVFTGAGEGQVAEEEFRHARFVPGQLKIVSPEKIEFVWDNIGSVEFRRDD
jgi:hypothetical protein